MATGINKVILLGNVYALNEKLAAAESRVKELENRMREASKRLNEFKSQVLAEKLPALDFRVEAALELLDPSAATEKEESRG